MFSGVEHVAIASADPQHLAKWYVENLEFRKIYEVDGVCFVKAANGAILELIPAQRDRTPQEMTDPGIRHMAISVADFDHAYQSLRAKDVSFVNEPYATPQGNRVVFFTDCEGNLLHLIQRIWPLPE
jgi:catechol 2,3-dioxygenase-like lactoylglutathione lyase family enzyme